MTICRLKEAKRIYPPDVLFHLFKNIRNANSFIMAESISVDYRDRKLLEVVEMFTVLMIS